MMKKTTTKAKDHRSERAKYHIQYYIPEFFNAGELDEGEETAAEPKTVKIPVKINVDGDE
mgnify:CR=1 FL=1